MGDQKTVLVINTAMEGCGVCIYDVARDAVFENYNDEAHGQAQRLIPIVQGVLASAAIDFEDLSDVVVCNGPGTFTGIRIGLSAAKTFGMVLDIPVWGISSLQGLALSVALEEDMLVMVETRRQDFYVQKFDQQGVAQSEAVSVMSEDIDVGGRVLIGDAVERFDPDGRYNDAGVRRIDAGEVARCFVKNSEIFSDDVSPIYLRAPDVSQPKKAYRTLKVK